MERRPAAATVCAALLLAGCSSGASGAGAAGSPSSSPSSSAVPSSAPDASGVVATPTAEPGVPDLATGCPSVQTVQGWVGGDWVVDGIADTLETVVECDYFSQPYDPASPTLLEGRYLILLTARGVPVATQLQSFRTAAEQTTGRPVVDTAVDGREGLLSEHPDGVFCQVMLEVSDEDTVLVVVADPATEMSDDCDVAQRIASGLLGGAD